MSNQDQSVRTTKTLEATFVRPTSHKQEKLESLLNTYLEALFDAFDAGCQSMSAVNDIVTPYDLPYQAKDSLKQYVPRLKSTYQANKLKKEHPIRLVNRAAVFDHNSARKHEFCWQVPQPGRGTNFWIPLQINPDQQNYWLKLVSEEITAGELQLQQTRTGWRLLVSITYSLNRSTRQLTSATAIGIDIGESQLITGCALLDGIPSRPLMVDGGRTKQLRKELDTTLKRLKKRGASNWRITERKTHYQNALTDIIEKTSREVIKFAQRFDNPVLALENLTYIREQFDYGSFMNRRLHSWAFARLQSRIKDKALHANIPIVNVNPRYTSKICHNCSVIGSRRTQSNFKCTNTECHITEFQADINAAINIAKRVNPWGESVPWKPDRDDFLRDGRPCDRACTQKYEESPYLC